MMLYQNLVLWGDSQFNGARTETDVAHELAVLLDGEVEWNVINRSFNGFTVKNLLEKIDDYQRDPDYFQCCLMIGANDCKEHTDPDLFYELYKRLLIALKRKGFSKIIIAEIPSFHMRGGDYPYGSWCIPLRAELNIKIRKFKCTLNMDMYEDHFVDCVHFSYEGVKECAKRLKEAL